MSNKGRKSKIRKPIEKLKSKRAIFNRLKNPKGWKKTTKRVTVSSEAAAHRVMDALIYYTGGAEASRIGPYRKGKRSKWRVGSKGYYHYIGA